MTDEHQPENLDSPEEESTSDDAESMRFLQEQLEEALREKDQFRAMAQRAQADFINYKRRAADEQDDIRSNANARLILKILAVGDDLNRAMDMIPEDAVAPSWLEGLQIVQRNLDNLLNSEGVSKIEAESQPFEPREHEAVYFEETSDVTEDMVVRVIRDGYRLHDKVLRAAQVTVAKPPESNNQNESSQQESQ